MEILIYGPRKGGTSLFQRLVDREEVFTHIGDQSAICGK